MQLVFTIHVIITLLMLKPATNKTCDNATYLRNVGVFCPRTSMYYTELPMNAFQTEGKCCEAVDPSYANMHSTCSFLEPQDDGLSFEKRDFGERFCPIGYYLNGFNLFDSIQCCRPLNHPKSYGPCIYEDYMRNSGQIRCQSPGYYITSFQRQDFPYGGPDFIAFRIRKLRCCKMPKTERERERERAMGSMAETKKRNDREGQPVKTEKTRRRSGGDMLEWLRERAATEAKLKERELDEKRKERQEIEATRKQQGEQLTGFQQQMLQLLQQQQQQQQQRQQQQQLAMMQQKC